MKTNLPKDSSSSSYGESGERIHLHLVLPPGLAIDFVLLVYEAVQMKEAYWGTQLLPEYLEEMKKLAVTLNLQLGHHQREELMESRFHSDYALSPAMKRIFTKVDYSDKQPVAGKWLVFDYMSPEGTGFNALGIIRGNEVLTQAGMPYCNVQHITHWRYAHIQEV